MLKITRFVMLLAVVVTVSSLSGGWNTVRPLALAEARPQTDSTLYLPVVVKPGFACPTVSTNVYAAGTAYQQDGDNPVRPAALHADKNMSLRGYNLDTVDAKTRQNLGSDDPNMPPQLGQLFEPDRIAPISNVYRINKWNWAPSPAPGTPGDEETNPLVTVVGLQTTAGEVLQIPNSGYDIGGGMEVIVLYADADTIAFKYTREDSVMPAGYLVHVDNICTDPNLLALYNQLDNPSGPRYVFANAGSHGYSYNLPNLPAGQVFGVAKGGEVRVAVVDSGTSQDPRSCYEFWNFQRPAPGGACPTP